MLKSIDLSIIFWIKKVKVVFAQCVRYERSLEEGQRTQFSLGAVHWLDDFVVMYGYEKCSEKRAPKY